MQISVFADNADTVTRSLVAEARLEGDDLELKLV